MKWWGWVLLGAAIMLLVCWLVKGDPSAREQELLDAIKLERERSAVLARADSLSQRRVDSLLALIGTIPVDTTSQREAREASARARQSAQEARQALALARTASDSLQLAIVALGASEAHRDTLETEVAIVRQDLEATGRMLALTREVVLEVSAQRDSSRAEASRLRLLLADAEGVIDKRRNFGQRIGRAGETVGIGAATYGACRDGLLTAGCLAGSIVTVARIL